MFGGPADGNRRSDEPENQLRTPERFAAPVEPIECPDFSNWDVGS